MVMDSSVHILWLVALAIVLVACQGGKVGHEPVARCEPEGACEPAMFEAGVGAARGEASSGATVYAAKCAVCHSADGKGQATTQTIDFTTAAWHARHSDGEIATRITRGSPPMMPGFRLAETDLRDLVAYLRSLRAVVSSQRPDGRGY
jgi:mono/diheme cytochrome c family protein